MITNKKVTDLISHSFSFSDIKDAYEILMSNEKSYTSTNEMLFVSYYFAVSKRKPFSCYCDFSLLQISKFGDIIAV